MGTLRTCKYRAGVSGSLVVLETTAAPNEARRRGRNLGAPVRPRTAFVRVISFARTRRNSRCTVGGVRTVVESSNAQSGRLFCV